MNRIINGTLYLVALIYVKVSKLTGFYNMSVHISKISFFYGNKIRYFFYKETLKNVGKNVWFSHNTVYSHTDISIGDNVRFGPYNTVGLVDFGDDILIGQSVHFLSGKEQHKFDKKDIPINKQSGIIKRIKIESDVWIGCGSIIMSNIGTGVVGAGSVITKDVDKFSVVSGNPASVIKKR